MPIFGDQPANAEVVVTEGWGVRLEFLEFQFSEEALREAVREVLENPSVS